MRCRTLFSIVALLVVAMPPAFAAANDVTERKILHTGWLLAVPGDSPRTDVSILVEGEQIAGVRSGFVRAEEIGWDAAATTIVDLRDLYVFPGLIDLHVHLTSPVEPGGALDVVTRDRADLALIAAQHAAITLQSGVTTVLDLGTGRREHEAAIYALRDAIAGGRIAGPRVFAVGSPLSATGSSRTGHYRDGVEEVVGPEGTCDGPEDCRRATREQVKRGADVISFYNTGSLGDRVILPQTMTDEEMVAIVETAHALGRPAIADGHNAPGLNAALRAGADALISATWPDETTWKLLRQSDAFFVSHVYAFEASVGDSEATLSEGTFGWLPPHMKLRLLDIKQQRYAAMIAHERGIPMALGSDTGVIHHGENARDLVEFVARGMSEMQALTLATVNGAAVLAREDTLGSIVPGKFADIVATRGNPLEIIDEVTNIVFVMKGGEVFRSPPQ